MENDVLFSLLKYVDEPTLQKMIDAGLFEESSNPLNQQFGIGQKMMDTPSAQGRQVGNTYVASSPLEHLANAVRQAVGARISGNAMTGEKDLATKVGAGRLAYLKLLQKRAAAQSGQQQPEEQQGGSGNMAPPPGGGDY